MQNRPPHKEAGNTGLGQISYRRKDVFHTSFSIITTPDFFYISPEMLGEVSSEGLSCEGAGTVPDNWYIICREKVR